MQAGLYESENGHRYGRYKVAYILELHSTFNLMFIKQIDYKSSKESILHIQLGSGQARVQQRRMVEVGAC